MPEKLRSLYTDPLYRNSIAMMLNSAFAAFFGLLFWIERHAPSSRRGLGIIRRKGVSIRDEAGDGI